MKKVLIGIILLIIIIFTGGLIFFLANNPRDVVAIEPINKAASEKARPGGVSIISWDIDHFSTDKKINNADPLEDFYSFFVKQEADFYLIQEVDFFSKRSNKENQAENLSKKLSDYPSYIGINKDKFLLSGRSKSGILSMSRYNLSKASEFSLASKKSFFSKNKNIMLITELESAEEEKNWCIINIDLSEIDNDEIDATLRKLNSYIVDRYKDGDFVVVGGNWGRALPGVDSDTFNKSHIDMEVLNTSWTLDDWQWCYDNRHPSCQLDEDVFTITDGFLVSPNLRVDMVRVFDDGFKFSNHNPVLLTVSIR